MSRDLKAEVLNVEACCAEENGCTRHVLTLNVPADVAELIRRGNITNLSINVPEGPLNA